MDEMKNLFIDDDAEMVFAKMEELTDEVQKHEETSKWFTGDDGNRAKDVRFLPILDEPLLVPANTANLRNQYTPKFKASDEAFATSIASEECGIHGTSQMMALKGELWPIGSSAIPGICEKLSYGTRGWNKLRNKSPQDLATALTCLMRNQEGNLSVLVQDEKIRAVNSGRYAILPISEVLDIVSEWLKKDYPNVQYVKGYMSHRFVSMYFNLGAYKNELFGAVPDIVNAGFEPGLIVTSSNVGESSVSFKPAFILDGKFGVLGMSIDIPHIAQGKTAEERTEVLREKVKSSTKLVFPMFKNAAAEVQALKNISVNNAKNALLRGLKSCGFAKEVSYSSCAVFEAMYGIGSCTAYDCYMAVVDAFCYAMDDAGGNMRKQVDAAMCLSRAVRYDWGKAGNYPGSFSW